MCIMLWALGPTRLLVQHTLTCTAHIFICTAHICLLYKGTHVYSLIKIYNTIKQPLSVELPTSSSHRPWVPDLQSLSLRSFILHRPLPFALTLQNITPITFVKVPLRSSYVDLHTYGSLNTIRNCTRPHAPLKGFVPQITRPTHHYKSRFSLTCSHAPQLQVMRPSRAFTRLNPPTDVIHVSPRCISR